MGFLSLGRLASQAHFLPLGSAPNRPLSPNVNDLHICVSPLQFKDRNDGNDQLALSNDRNIAGRKGLFCVWVLGEGMGPTGAELIMWMTEGRLPSPNMKTCTNELNISNMMTL
jgi:hypothetical protein